ncbi:MAG: 1-deoxy-D-xylulose-5-phosphate synthase [Bacteroidales bacterium]|nr:1-deoxy-D-xylulose-5-phosphate synthase [Bacteroidales bacterium]
MYDILDRIDSPSDLKGLSIGELKELCSELRRYMVECCAVTPGHLGSSLGAVELIVAMHYVYDAPKDKLVFDVGHQAYAHKILTGRREAFKTLRTGGGISGFPKRDESPYDAFGAGHSSTSVSAALGFAEAARMQGLDQKAVALIGDGAMSGGLAYEGLNNAGDSKADLLVILNDNEMSIDLPQGGLHNHLLKITTSGKYNSFKDKVWESLGERNLRRSLSTWIRSIKSWLVKRTGGDYFESLGFRYFGPVDGNNLEEVIGALQRIKNLGGPRLLHCITRKGKGYAPAEQDPVVWHAPGRFNPETGERLPGQKSVDRYQDVFGRVLLDLAGKDPKVVGITPAMASGCGMSLLARERPQQFFDVGIEEEHAVTFSAGLAAGGMKPFCNIYSSFAQRAYDQVIHDVALQKLPVVICLDRAGLVGEDGGTHNGAFDLAAFRCIPDTIISAPRNELELKNLMYTAYLHDTGPFIIRYPRGLGEGVAWKDSPMQELPLGKAETLLEGDTVALVCIGPVANRALEAAQDFPGRVGVYDFRFLKPLDHETLDLIAGRYSHILTLEDGSLKGGLYGAVCEHLACRPECPVIEGAGIPDAFTLHARQADQRRDCGLDKKGISDRIGKILAASKN